MEILSFTGQYLIKINNHVTVKLCRDDTMRNQAEWYISQVLCYPDWQIEALSILEVPVHLGEYDNSAVVWVAEERMIPVVSRLLEDSFGVFLKIEEDDLDG